MRRQTAPLTVTFLLAPMVALLGQSDTLYENFNGTCDLFDRPYKNFTLEYTGPNGIHWDVQTYYQPTAGGIEDDGSIAQSSNHCGSLYWTTGKSGYAKAFLDTGITELSFQVLSGNFEKDGFVKVIVDGELIGQTKPITGYKVETYTFTIDTPGPLMLELSHGVKEGSTYGGILVDNLKWTPREGTRPFFRVETLDEYIPGMDTLTPFLDTMEILIDTRGCVTLNGEYYDYLGMVETADIHLGAVIDLEPYDSTNIYYWGYAKPSGTGTGEELPVQVSVPVNNVKDTMLFVSVENGDSQEGMLSFLNGNIDKDLVVFRVSKMQHEYRIRYAVDSYLIQDTTMTGDAEIPPATAVEFFPNPVKNIAYFRTLKKLGSFHIVDLNGRIVHSVQHPVETSSGYYQFNLENLDSGVWIVRFVYTDLTMNAVKIVME